MQSFYVVIFISVSDGTKVCRLCLSFSVPARDRLDYGYGCFDRFPDFTGDLGHCIVESLFCVSVFHFMHG